jgi:hypothetical protein
MSDILKLQTILKRMYESVDKMNKYLLKGDTENARREQIAQQQIHKQFKEAKDVLG